MGIEKYAGRVALVTGASAGVGAGIVQALLRHGLTVVGFARRVDKIKALELKDAPGKLYAIEGDLSNEESILSAFKWIRENLSGVDILINNAGFNKESDLSSAPTELWRQIVDVNVMGLSICTREAVQDMLRRSVDDGFIIHINSIAGHWPTTGSDNAMYCGCKQAVKALLEGLRKDLVARNSKIRVGEISPGIIRTEFHLNRSAQTRERVAKMPYLLPEDLAEATVYMLSQPPRVQVYDIIILPTGSS